MLVPGKHRIESNDAAAIQSHASYAYNIVLQDTREAYPSHNSKIAAVSHQKPYPSLMSTMSRLLSLCPKAIGYSHHC